MVKILLIRSEIVEQSNKEDEKTGPIIPYQEIKVNFIPSIMTKSPKDGHTIFREDLRKARYTTEVV